MEWCGEVGRLERKETQERHRTSHLCLDNILLPVSTLFISHKKATNSLKVLFPEIPFLVDALSMEAVGKLASLPL